MRKLPFLFAIAALAACGDNAGLPDAHVHVDSSSHPDAKKDAAVDAPPDAPSQTVIDLAGGANALLWNDATHTLFLTNDDTDKLQKYTDAGGVVDVATLPTTTAANGISLGGIIQRATGQILVADFGFGTDGNIFSVASATATSGTALTLLNATRKRIQLAIDSAGTMYSSYFTGPGSAPVGGVATLAVAASVGTEVEIAKQSSDATPIAFKKIVGLAATPTAVFASDQSNKVIWKITIPAHVVTQFNTAALPSADLLLLLPNGDLLTGGGPTISRISTTGAVSALTVPTGVTFETVNGIAFDPTGHRLFVIDHSATATVPDKLHIFAFTP